jgi:cytochrome P450
MRSTRISRRATVPGPRGHVFLGVLPELRRNPLEVFLSAARDYGDFVRLPVGPRQVTLLNRPDYIKRVLQDNHRNYRLTPFYKKLKPIFGDGLFASEGERWSHQRDVVQPAFHRMQLERLAPVMTAAAERLIERWRARAQGGEPGDVAEEMAQLTLEIVAQAMFGTDLSDEAEDASRAIRTLLETAVERTTDLTGLAEHLPTPRNRRFRRALRAMDELVYGLLDRRRREEAARRDLLSLLLDDRARQGDSDEAPLRDEAMTMLVSGSVTTGNALTWTWYVLARFPEVERRLREEVSAVLRGRTPGAADLANLDYTRMVIQETLRLFPPTWRLARTAIGRDDIGGHAIARNSIGVFSPYLVHRHADFWDEPEAFRPERFAPENSIARPRYAYIPFGGGPRACVGSQFAMMEMQLVVAAVAQAFHLRLAPGYAVEPEPVATLRPRHGLMMRLEECTTRGEASRAPLRRSL